MSEIDFVIAWVDGEDAAWLEDKSKYAPQEERMFNQNMIPNEYKEIQIKKKY